jgi:hypothetical protein
VNGEHFDPIHAYFATEEAPPFASAKSVAHGSQCPADVPASISVDADGTVSMP